MGGNSEYLSVFSSAACGILTDFLETHVIDWTTFCKMCFHESTIFEMTSTNGTEHVTNTSDNVDAVSTSLRIPPFWPHDVMLWFLMLELHLSNYQIIIRSKCPHYKRQGKILHHRRESYRTVYTPSPERTVRPAEDGAGTNIWKRNSLKDWLTGTPSEC